MIDRTLGLGSLVAAIGLAFVGDGADASALSPIAWEGPAPHVWLEGRLEGETISARFEGERALRVARAACAPIDSPWGASTDARGIHFELASATGSRRFDLTFVGERLSRGRDGEHLRVVPLTATGDVASGSVAFALEWRSGHDETARGRASDGGAFHRVHFDAPGDEDARAGHLAARWSDGDFLDLSFTIPCDR